MKTVLKISLLVLIFSLSINSTAQKYAIEIGYTNPAKHGTNFSPTYFYGGRIGGTANFDLKNNLSLLTGALYSYVYSDKLIGYPNSGLVTQKTTGQFIDIPIHVLYSLPISKTLKVFGYAGPNINIGLSQKQDITSTLTYLPGNPLYVKPESSDLFSDKLLNRINLQIGLGGGIQWKKYQIKSGYDFGVTNLNKIDTGNLFQRGWYVSFSYEF
jgi:hypothetical protein